MARPRPTPLCESEHGPLLVLGPHVALTAAPTDGVALFRRRPPVHSIVIGRCRVLCADAISSAETLAIPANTPHTLLSMEQPHAAVAYLDARRYRFEDAQRLAHRWRGFRPGHDDLREAFGDATALPRLRSDARVLRALEILESEDVSVAEAARRVALSPSRLTHRTSEALGAPPRAWSAWFKLRRAIGACLFERMNLTQAAHRAGFADSAHLTRTCKQLTGVLPSQMMPRAAYVSADESSIPVLVR